jgi:hypothetical protein
MRLEALLPALVEDGRILVHRLQLVTREANQPA